MGYHDPSEIRAPSLRDPPEELPMPTRPTAGQGSRPHEEWRHLRACASGPIGGSNLNAECAPL